GFLAECRAWYSSASRRSVLDRDEFGDRRAQDLELALDELFGDVRLGRGDLEPGPIGHIRRCLDRELRGEVERLVLRGRHVVVQLGLGDGTNARVFGGTPEPTVDVRLDGLAEDAVAADPRLEHLLRGL